MDLVYALEELRALAGKPIYITSGKRCDNWNEMVGGAPRSQHLYGMAADIVIPGLHPIEMETLATKVWRFRQGGIGVYPSRGYIHVDIRPGGNARWTG